jgi:hypothetical protein
MHTNQKTTRHPMSAPDEEKGLRIPNQKGPKGGLFDLQFRAEH